MDARLVAIFLCGATLGAVAACDSVPVHGLRQSFTMTVDKRTGDSESIKIDFLWVVDNSTSMCQEQVNLTDNFNAFSSTIRAFSDNFDARVAVATVDVQCDDENLDIAATKGEFSNRPAISFAPPCQARVVMPCQSDTDCVDVDCKVFGHDCGGEQAPWSCMNYHSLKCITTPNGSETTECVRRCVTDEECQALFGDKRYFCHQPSTNQADWGCMLPPQTQGLSCKLAEEADGLCDCSGDGYECTRALRSCPYSFGVPAKTPAGCDKNHYHRVNFACCPGDMSFAEDAPPCESLDVDFGAGNCMTEEEWKQFGATKCGEAGLGFVEDPTTVLPRYLDAHQLGLFQCLATVGVNQNKCYKYEQGLRAALMALDPTGPNASQAAGFLRDDAYLVIVFVTDEDDCSVPDNRSIPEGFHDRCAFRKTVDQGGELVPVGHYVNLYKSLKRDPSSVIVAAIAGDAVVPDFEDMTEADKAYFVDPQNPTDEELEAYKVPIRQDFVAAKDNPTTCYQKSYVCLSGAGRADWGQRYQQLTEGFGPNGIFENICSPAGIQPALEKIAKQIVRVISKVCLPADVLGKPEDSLVVRKWTTSCDPAPCADGYTCEVYGSGATMRCVKTLTANDHQGDSADEYELVPGGSECVLALSFGDAPPTSGQEITLTYLGDPKLSD